LKLLIENYVLNYFVIPSLPLRRPFADPSHKLRASAQDSIRVFFYSHSEPLLFVILSDSEESPQETLRLRLRVTEKGHSFASLRTALRGRAPQKVNDFLGTPRLAPQNDGMREKPYFPIGKFRTLRGLVKY